MEDVSVKAVIDKTIQTVNDNFDKKSRIYRKLSYDNLIELSKNLTLLFNEYINIDEFDCGKIVRTKYIPFLNLMLKIDNNNDNKMEYYKELENAYRVAARTSLEHFIIYYEWDFKDKVLEKRYEILQSYVYYLNKMCFDPSFEGIIANLPSRLWKIKTC